FYPKTDGHLGLIRYDEAGGVMHRTIPIPDLQQSFREVLEEVKNEHVPYVLTDDSRPEAVLVPYDEFLKFQRFREAEILARFDELWARIGKQNAEISEQEIDEDIATACSERSQQ
ncbi:MAG TPA: type II toxin-antitoxin system Phd/YefM family antitoxin, partial [Thermoanaerobaculia bacterium]